MPPIEVTERVELGSVEMLPDGEGFVLGLVDSKQEVRRMELPSWTVHQLMRVLPRLDAALQQARNGVPSELVAYPIVRWAVECTGSDHSVALSVQTDRHVESAFLLAPADARAIHSALGSVLPPACLQVKPP